MTTASCRSAITVGSALFLSLTTVAVPAKAADLFIAGTIGEVYKGDSETGGFQPFGGACLGPIQALAMDDSNIYAGDLVGGVIRFDLATGQFLDIFFAPNSITAMVMHDGDLLISENSGEIYRVDPMTGSVESTLQGPYGIDAMLLLGDDLFVSSALEGSVWKGDPVSGNFDYFGCGCAGPAQGLANDDSNLYAGDAFGLFVRYDLSTGFLLDEGVMPFGISAMVRDGDDLLLSESNGTIHRINPLTREELDTMTSPITVAAMQRSDQPLPGDTNDDGAVGIADLLVVLGEWGQCQSPCPPSCAGDVNDDCAVDVADLLTVLANWS